MGTLVIILKTVITSFYQFLQTQMLISKFSKFTSSVSKFSTLQWSAALSVFQLKAWLNICHAYNKHTINHQQHQHMQSAATRCSCDFHFHIVFSWFADFSQQTVPTRKSPYWTVSCNIRVISKAIVCDHRKKLFRSKKCPYDNVHKFSNPVSEQKKVH